MLYELVQPFLFRMDPERAHHLVLSLLADTPASTLLGFTTRLVERPVELWGLTFRNPLGLAAGFDKDCVALRAWHDLGFGFVEAGTVTRHPQPGNPRPRIFRLSKERALINRLGFPSAGAADAARRLERYRKARHDPRFPIGVNIGKSKATPLEEAEEDYLETFRALHDHGDFFVVNVSSPNTPGLRELQRPEELRAILRALRQESAARGAQKPLLVKIAPDLDDGEIAGIAGTALDLELEGIVATNTTLARPGISLDEKGGLSGAPLRERSTEVIRRVHRETGGRIPIVGVGGVFTRDDYLEKIDAGATLVEIYTGFVYEGPKVVSKILGE